jgi:transposase
MLLLYANGKSINAIATTLGTYRSKIELCVQKALDMGIETALKDLPGRGVPRKISQEARAWLIQVACQKPKDLGYSYELWTNALLMKHARKFGPQAGHASLASLARGTVSKILSSAEIRPHKITYYCEKRDPDFDKKMAQVLCVYREVEVLKAAGDSTAPLKAILSYDEKPGVQAIGTTSPDQPPIPGEDDQWARDHEYVRHGTVSIMAGIDLVTGIVHAQVVERHRSKEFVEWLEIIAKAYPPSTQLTIILDNHSAHISKETRAYLAKKPNRFSFCFTPKHGSWLNLIESFFAKMTKSVLRGIRVASKSELVARLCKYFEEINAQPVVFKWSYKMAESVM